MSKTDRKNLNGYTAGELVSMYEDMLLIRRFEERIDELFKKSSLNLSYASELKEVLDEWGVYKEYEDKFLDLFKKRRLDH